MFLEVILMAQPLRNTDEIQKNLGEFQELQRQAQVMASQRQQLSMQVEEIRMAEEGLSKADKDIYRATGPLLIETTKAEAASDLKEKKELFDMRIGVLSKQEEKLRPRMEELRAVLEKAIQESRQQK